MKHAITGLTIIPKIYNGEGFVYIAEKVWDGEKWVKIDYYNMQSYLEMLLPDVCMGENTSFRIVLNIGQIA